MKYAITLMLTAAAFYVSVGGQKNKIEYNFPSAMPEHVKASYLELCEKGRALYEVNCAQCHSKTEKRKTIIPDFTQEQLIGYELRVKNPKHESSIPETTVTAEELSLITTFLTYKKRNS